MCTKATQIDQIDGLVQDCSNTIANALEFLQSCTKPSKWPWQLKTVGHFFSLFISMNNVESWHNMTPVFKYMYAINSTQINPEE